jgi:hypothetical protein
MSKCWAGFDFWFDDIHELHRVMMSEGFEEEAKEMFLTC